MNIYASVGTAAACYIKGGWRWYIIRTAYIIQNDFIQLLLYQVYIIPHIVLGDMV